jgi:hypothetical protein
MTDAAIVIEHGARRLLHFNLTQHPTAQWTLQQLREVVSFRDGYRYYVTATPYTAGSWTEP